MDTRKNFVLECEPSYMYFKIETESQSVREVVRKLRKAGFVKLIKIYTDEKRLVLNNGARWYATTPVRVTRYNPRRHASNEGTIRLD